MGSARWVNMEEVLKVGFGMSLSSPPQWSMVILYVHAAVIKRSKLGNGSVKGIQNS